MKILPTVQDVKAALASAGHAINPNNWSSTVQRVTSAVLGALAMSAIVFAAVTGGHVVLLGVSIAVLAGALSLGVSNYMKVKAAAEDQAFAVAAAKGGVEALKRGDVLISRNILDARREMIATFGYQNLASASLKPSIVKAEADAERRSAEANRVAFGPMRKPLSYLQRLGNAVMQVRP